METTSRWSRLRTTTVRDYRDIRGFFDARAQSYAETHGNPTHLLQYRLSLIREHARFQPTDVVLDSAVAADCIYWRWQTPSAAAWEWTCPRPWCRWRGDARRVAMAGEASVYKAEQLGSVADASVVSVAVVFSGGALEHMLDQAGVLANAFRGLRFGGRFVCLTPNGHYLWYRWLAPWCGLETRHLSTDWFL